VVVQTAMEAGSFEALEVTEAACAKASSSPRCSSRRIRRSSRTSAAPPSATSPGSTTRTSPTRSTWPRSRSGCSTPWPRAGSIPGDPEERDLLWAAGLLHDIGVSVDYDDHHKHSRYLILSAGLPGYTTRETALIGQMARYHRKGSPGLGEFGPLARRGDEARVTRCSALLRLAEQLERARDRAVHGTRVEISDDAVCLRLEGEDAPARALGRPAAGDIFQRAFGRRLEVAREPVGALARAEQWIGGASRSGSRPRSPDGVTPRDVAARVAGVERESAGLAYTRRA
jgi:exopolyphosphatase/guanosine-5'-triphosphate,3'-diphosphate pyrophosphatase